MKTVKGNKEIFETMPIPKALMTLAVPMIISQLVVLVYNLADTFYIGKTNNPLMVAGASLVLPVYNISIALAGIAGIGGGSLISRLLGAGNEEDARKVSVFSFYLSVGVALCFAISMSIFMHPVLTLLGASNDTYLYAKQYGICVIVLGGLPTVMSITMSNLLRSVGYAKQAGFGISMGGIINIIIDPIFMFLIFPRGMETAAAGIATMCSNIVVCAYFLFFIYKIRKNTVLTFSLKEGFPSRKYIFDVFYVGVPGSIGGLLFDLNYIVIDKLATLYGDIPLAAIGIVLKAERLPLNVGIGLCQGMMPISAYNFSSGDHKRMRDVVSCSRLYGIVFAIISVVFYEIFASYIMRFFINDAQTVLLGTNFLRARVLATPLMFLSFHPSNYFQSVGKGSTALFLIVMRWLAFNIPMLFILNAIFGMYGIVWSQITADVFTVTLSFIVYYRFQNSLKGISKN